MNAIDLINVPQLQYAVALRDSEPSRLITENILTCTAWFGVDRKNGVAFLCHFDSVESTESVLEIVGEVRKHVADLRQFQTYIVNGTRLARSLWQNRTRASLLRQIESLDVFPEPPIDLGFVRTGLRSRVIINAKTGKWRRMDYVWQPLSKNVKATSKKMRKADGSK